MLASGSWDTTVKVWKPFESVCLQTFSGHGGYVNGVAFLQDKTTLVSAHSNGTIQFWDLTKNHDNASPIKIYQKNSESVCCLTVLKNGWIATGHNDCAVRIWDPTLSPDKALIWERWVHTGHVTALTVRADHILVSGSSDKTLILWNPDTGDFWQSPAEHTNWVTALEALPDNTILSGSNDHTIKMWK
ncbi:MAG: hypothetical protein HWD61_14560 [Parachlamydiaceae bacterium]|nr:MAG: hypothetical protein HWD61_14560 [Parachlamydiaceae bacterium]